ncbi:FkbM family methyltransferase [Salinisphaera sp. P385]|uniref:FkbM family methyltransferase n=1 Tax=Spectribacter acetivorans TaxID=3075603 RepID=A0ABU3B997_9GAMM|nr:FkbM family methyltransferase [Salinisphaera sp. P385]MDT0619045.1 FkbM family methyltransferase [Salinisphaera sp. P385]
MKRKLSFLANKFGKKKKARRDLSRLKSDTASFFSYILQKNCPSAVSHSQISQDIVALISSNFKRGGYFVEFGATNGIDLSNTYMLEQCFGWHGILAEPGVIWHEDLVRNRSAHIDFSCVWRATGEILDFDLVEEAELSTLKELSSSDSHGYQRTKSVPEKVSSISLEDLLRKYDAPRHIDYLSVDTEGSELEILRNFNFNNYDISFISCEHNYTKNREAISELLKGYGFSRRFEELSKWDDWYFRD